MAYAFRVEGERGRLFRAVIREVLAPPAARQLAATLAGARLLGLLAVVAGASWIGHAVAALGRGHAWAPAMVAAGAALAVRGGAEATVRAVAAEWACRVRETWQRRLVEGILTRGPGDGGADPARSVAVATAGIDQVATVAEEVMPRAVTAVLAPAVVLVVLWAQYWVAGLVATLTLPLIPVMMTLVGYAAEREGRRQWALLTGLEARFLDLVEGVPTLRVFGQYRRARTQIHSWGDRYQVAAYRTARIGLLSGLVLELFSAIALALVAVAVGLALVAGHLSLAAGLTVLIVAPEAFFALRQLGAGFHQAIAGLAAAEALWVEATPPARMASRAGKRPGAPWTISMEDAMVMHPARPDPLWAQMSWQLPAGGHLVVTGPNGSGKTTLLRVLLGLWPLRAGRVRVAGLSLNEVDLGAWRAAVGYVAQFPYFLDDTVRNNLLWVRPGADDRAIWQALEAAEAARFVAALPEGLETRLGDKGMALSAGMRARLALARLFLRDAPVAFLDEPTRHLDAVTQGAVLEHLAAFLAGRTAVVVTHDPAEMRLGDQVLQLGPEARGEAVRRA